MNLKEFKSGTDIRGYGVPECSDEPLFLSDEIVSKIVTSYVLYLSSKTGIEAENLTVSIGRDSRISGPRILKAAADAMLSLGVCVKDCGLASTPAMFMSTILLGCDGAVQITASHHPWQRNGLKFFTKNGGLESEDIAEILKKAENIEVQSISTDAKAEPADIMTPYSEHLKSLIKKGVNAENYDKPLDGFKIIVDAGNGVGGFYAVKVLEPLGADISGSQFLEPDGRFPNHIPNPENADAMKSVSDATVKSSADLGIIFDTDVDRAGCVDKSGEEINRNRLVALASYIALEKRKEGVIVTDSVTSDGLKDYINSLGGEHLRFKRGYKNVINKQIELNNDGRYCPLAIETSGHAAFNDNYYLDDGAYLMTRIIILLAKDKGGHAIENILSTLREPVEAEELRFDIRCDGFREYGNRVIDELTDYYKSKKGFTVADDNYEGVRISADKENGDGWMLLRLSVHDPVMPFNIESNVTGGAKRIAGDFYEFIKNYDSLVLKPLENFISS